MALASYNKSADTIFYFDFWDDATDFTTMSAQSNQILHSTGFLT
jgi:hypothetical protein